MDRPETSERLSEAGQTLLGPLGLMANSISGANLDDAVASMTQRLPSGCVLRVTDRHAALTLGPSDGWTAVSSAVLHGPLERSTGEQRGALNAPRSYIISSL